MDCFSCLVGFSESSEEVGEEEGEAGAVEEEEGEEEELILSKVTLANKPKFIEEVMNVRFFFSFELFCLLLSINSLLRLLLFLYLPFSFIMIPQRTSLLKGPVTLHCSLPSSFSYVFLLLLFFLTLFLGIRLCYLQIHCKRTHKRSL